MKSFDRAARSYESFGFIQRELAAWLAEWLPVQREGTAIEAGAGTGFFTKHLLPWNGRLLATDASAAMVARGAASEPGAEWLVAPANDLPDVPANWIFSSSFLQWAEEPNDLLRLWKSRLLPGGRILSGLFVAPTLGELASLLPGSTPLQWRTPETWEEMARGAGFTLARAEALERPFVFPSALQLLRTLHGIGATPVRRLPGTALRQAIGQYDAEFAHDGGVRSTWTFFRFEAIHPAD